MCALLAVTEGHWARRIDFQLGVTIFVALCTHSWTHDLAIRESPVDASRLTQGMNAASLRLACFLLACSENGRNYHND